jgi:preprotein translocase subunit SecY
LLSSLKNMFKVPDLRNKILFTLMMLAIYRLGSHVPVPGIDLSAVKQLQDQAKNGGVLSFLQLFSGGALTQFAVFALGIMPYITSSIIMQILTVVIPKLEQWQEQGAVGQRKITQWTRYLTIAIALVQSFGLSYLFHNGGGGFGRVRNTTGIDLFGGDQNFNLPRISLVVLTLVAGTALLMWMGELITQRGIGNGMSLLIFASVVSTMPASGGQIKAEKGTAWLIALCGIGIIVLIAIVFVEQGQRRIPVQFAKRVVGRRMYGGQSTYIPLKVNQAGVIPIIFASSVLYLPVIAGNILPVDANHQHAWGNNIQKFINDHVIKQDDIGPLVLYGLLIIGFTYF